MFVYVSYHIYQNTSKAQLNVLKYEGKKSGVGRVQKCQGVLSSIPVSVLAGGGERRSKELCNTHERKARVRT